MTRLRTVLATTIAVLLAVAACDEAPTGAVNPAASADLSARAAPNALFDLDFSSASDAGDVTATAAGWLVDRRDTEAWETAVFDGDARLHIDIDEAGPTTGFYGYQGRKYLDAGETSWHAEAQSRLSYRFYIDPAWEGDGVGQQTGMWVVLGTAQGDISAYPILEYQDSDASDEGEAGFRAFVYEPDFTANWLHIGLPKQLKIDPDEGGWVTVEAQLHKTSEGAALKWRVNNKLVLDERNYNVFAPSIQILEPILNSANFGVDQDYYYDDIRLVASGSAGGN